MKKYSLLLFIALCSLLGTPSIKGQSAVNINIGTQPLWGPVSYDHVDYYYLPEYDVYYYAPREQFIYYNNGRWNRANRLPYRFLYVNLFSTYKVVINEPRPYLRHDYYHKGSSKF